MARIVSPTLACAALVLSCTLSAAAQPAGQAQPSAAAPGSAPPGLSMDGDQPVRIVSNTLEVRDKIRQATFAGDVKLTQGDTVINCKVLVVFYEDTAAPTKKGAPPPATAGAQPPPKSGQKIKRAEAKGDVFVIQKDQTAKGDNAVFDVKTNTVVITGNVVVTQGGMVTRGDRFVSNLTTGVTSVTTDNSPVASAKGSGPLVPARKPGQVEVLIEPGSSKDAKATPAPAAAAPPPAPPPSAAKAAPKGPMRLN